MRDAKAKEVQKSTRAVRKRRGRVVLRDEEFYEPRLDGAYPEDVDVFERLVARLPLTTTVLVLMMVLLFAKGT